MKTARLLYLLSFASLAVLAAVALDRFLEPSLTYRLLAAEGIAILAGAAGLAHRRAWPAAVVFLPLGAYLLLRTLLPLPAGVQGAAAQAHFYWEALATGASQYLDKFFPLNLSDAPELALLLALALYLFTWLAAFLALSLRQAVAGVALFLVPLGFGLTVGAGARAVPSVVGYIAAATILLALARRIQDPQARPRHLLSRLLIGGALGLTASGLSLLLLTLAPGAAAAPWQDWRVWGSPHQVRSVYVFNWQQNYPRLLDPANKQIIMKVRSPVPTYWRASALDTFTGTTWLASQLFLHSVSPVQSGSTYTYTIPPADLSPAGRPVTEVFQMDSVLTNYLLVGGEPVSIKIDQPLTLRLNDMRALHVSKALGPRFTYTVQAVIPTIKPTDLVGRGREYPEAISRYLNLPFMRISEIPGPDKAVRWRDAVPQSDPDGWEWVDLYDLNKSIIQDATDPYEITLRIEQFLRRSYTYSLTPPPSNYRSPYTAFLFDTHAGYCQHFAGAMALLLRFNDIPARVAVGFVPGETEGDETYLVSTNNAHAWVEVYFPRVGWVAFDPTPGRSIPTPGASSTSPGFTNPFTQENSSSGSQAPGSSGRNNIPEGDSGSRDLPSAAGSQNAGRLVWVIVFAAVVAGLFGVASRPGVRILAQKIRLRRGPAKGRLEFSLRFLREDLRRYGIAAPPSLTLEELAALLESRLGISPGSTLLGRWQAVLFGGRPAVPADVISAEKLRHEVLRALRRHRGWVRSLIAWYGLHRRATTGGVTK